MTPAQSVVWVLATRLNKDEFEGWFAIESIMAFVQIESNFRPHAYRKEPSGVASYGLMQVLDVTAKEFKIDDPQLMWQPEIGLRTGLKVAHAYWETLTKHFGHVPTLAQWAASYNEGPGNVFKGRPDMAYVVPWHAARDYWREHLK